MTPDAIAADSSFLTIDQAVANLDAAEVEREDEAPAKPDAASPEGQNTEAEPAAEVAEEPETAIEGEDAETEDAEAEGEQPELPAIEPPRFWDAEAKDRFRELPRDLQELVLSKEQQHDKATAAKFEEAAAIRKASEAEASKLGELNAKLDKLIPQAEQMFASRWGVEAGTPSSQIDWNRVAREEGVESAFTKKSEYEQALAGLDALKAAQQETQAENTKKFVAERLVKLATTCPDLVDSTAGNDRQLELVKFWTGLGKDANRIIYQADDVELSVLYDAMRFRQQTAAAKAKADAPKTPAQLKPAATPRPSVRPTAAPNRSGSPQSARLQQLLKKSSWTTDEAVEVMDLQTGT